MRSETFSRLGLVAALLLVAAMAVPLFVGNVAPRTARSMEPPSPKTKRPPPASRSEPALAVVERSAYPNVGARLDPDEIRDDLNRIPGEPVTIRGRVWRGQTPANGVEVRLFRAYHAHEDRVGWSHRDLCWGWWREQRRTVLAEVRAGPAGEFVLRVKRRSRLVVEARDASGCCGRQLLHLPLVGNPGEIRLRLVDGEKLGVRVVAPSGAPVPGRAVEVAYGTSRPVGLRDIRWREANARSSAAPLVRRRSVTDPQGRAVFAGLEPGPVIVQVGAVRETVVVPVGNEVAFVHEDPGRVRGTLRDSAGMPLPGHVLHLELGTALGRIAQVSTRTDESGRFELQEVQPGGFHSARVEGRGPLAVPARSVVSGEATIWDPVSPRPGRIAGVALDARGRPLSGVVLLLTHEHETIGRMVTGPDGRFTFPKWREGAHDLQAFRHGLYGRGSARTDSGDQQITLRPCARVQGRVRDLHSPEDHRHRVALMAEGFSRVVAVDSRGRFAFEHVPPLEGAWIKGEGGETGTFDIHRGEVVEIELRSYPKCIVRGTVRDAAGRPVSGAVVMASMSAGFLDARLLQPGWTHNTSSGADGSYLVRTPIVKGRMLSVLAKHPGYAPARIDRIAMRGAGKTIRRDMVLRRGEPLGGKVLYADGRPMRFALVKVLPLERGFDGRGRYRIERTTRSDASGRFLFEDLAQDRYAVQAFDAEVGCVLGTESATGQQGVVLTAEHRGFIAGTVVDADGRPLSDYGFGMVSAGKHLAMVGPGGRFRIGNLPEGAYDVRFLDFAIPVRSVPTGTDHLILRPHR